MVKFMLKASEDQFESAEFAMQVPVQYSTRVAWRALELTLAVPLLLLTQHSCLQPLTLTMTARCHVMSFL